MAKNKPVPLDVEEEHAERLQFAGLLKQEIQDAASAIRTQKEKNAASIDVATKSASAPQMGSEPAVH